MVELIKALIYALFNPYEIVYLSVVRRYLDAQNNFIGELYIGRGREGKMIGMSCDSLPYNRGLDPCHFLPINDKEIKCKLELDQDFLAPMLNNCLRVGSMEPQYNDAVRKMVGLRRFCDIRVMFMNRFIEHVMKADYERKR